ncbi:hypothetical protein [Phaeovulum sp.]|uniref:hypothetical protein n=1 Tax=Phaeovulum sp. TaxID=2934796 RepID=UPI0030154A22
MATGSGGAYRVYTAFWRAIEAQGVEPPPSLPPKLVTPEPWLASARLADWGFSGARADKLCQGARLSGPPRHLKPVGASGLGRNRGSAGLARVLLAQHTGARQG